MLIALLSLPTLLTSAPLEWRCYPDLYGDGFSCDCGCGIVDPDCGYADGAFEDFAACSQSFCAAGEVPLQGAPGACVPNVCGDGFATKGEACDDGDGPGCDDTCQVVADGFRCSALGAGCSVPRCGDRIVDADRGERCDDGNDAAGDGCDQCAPEPGYVCHGFGGCAPTTCGDGIVDFDWETQSGETCEDGNSDGGDGCDAFCRTEKGWVCRFDGCVPIVCGEGVVARGDFGDGEQCDDGNTDAGDGCDAGCQVEPGWSCDDVLGCSQVICGDLVLEPGEMCDDGNSDDGDGCGAGCQSEPGWSCKFTPGDCQQVVCGDGVVMGDDSGTVWEDCDDGNSDADDGCDATCHRELGWVCKAGEACHRIVCGDGIVDSDGGGGPKPLPDGAADKVPVDPGGPGGPGGPGTPTNEECDDGNSDDGDGCSSACAIEAGWFCVEPGHPCVKPVCGDGKVEGDESCDDDNDLGGDGCSAKCTREPGYVCREAGKACEPMPHAWVCSQFIYGSGDGCDCGCGAPDPDCPTPADVADCQFNHCLEDAPWPSAEDPTACGRVAPPIEVGPEVVEAVEQVETIETVEPAPDAGPDEDAADAAEAIAEGEDTRIVPPTNAEGGCAGGSTAAGALVGLALVVARRRRPGSAERELEGDA